MSGDLKVGFIGAGQMAEALARGFIAQSMVKPENIVCTDPVELRKDVFKSFGAVPVQGNHEVATPVAGASTPRAGSVHGLPCCKGGWACLV